MEQGGGACPQRHSLTESPASARFPDVQARVFLGLGNYLDRPRSNADENDLRTIVEVLREQMAQRERTCREIVAGPLPLSEAIGDILGRASLETAPSGPASPVTNTGGARGGMGAVDSDLSIRDNANCRRAIQEAIRGVISPVSVITRDRYAVTPNPDVIARVENLINSDPALRSALVEHAAPDAIDPSRSQNAQARLSPLWNRLLNTIIPREQLAAACPTTDSTGSPLRISGLTSASFVQAVHRSKHQQCGEALAPDADTMNAGSLKAMARLDSRVSCLAPSRQEDLFNAVLPLLAVGYRIENLGDNPSATLRGGPSGADRMLEILMPQCRDRQNLIALNNITCSEDSFCRRDSHQRWSNPYAGGSHSCLPAATSRNIMRRKITAGIREGRALGLAVCAAFLNNPQANTNHCLNRATRGDGGTHEMSVVGYKCVAGQMKYQILNSWGNECPISSGPTTGGRIECEVRDGRLTLWMTEDALTENAIGLTEVKVRP
jgi:hypothetical protein